MEFIVIFVTLTCVFITILEIISDRSYYKVLSNIIEINEQLSKLNISISKIILDSELNNESEKETINKIKNELANTTHIKASLKTKI